MKIFIDGCPKGRSQGKGKIKMKCKDCEYFKIKDKARIFNGTTWSWGMAECKKYGYKKAFKNDLEIDRLECIGGEYQSRSSVSNELPG